MNQLHTVEIVACIKRQMRHIHHKMMDNLDDKFNPIDVELDEDLLIELFHKFSTEFEIDGLIIELNRVDLQTQRGNNTQTCSDNTVFGHTQCLIDKWGSDSASTIYAAANNAYTT